MAGGRQAAAKEKREEGRQGKAATRGGNEKRGREEGERGKGGGEGER